MSVSVREVIESAGYKLDTIEDARWLLAQEDLFDEMIDAAQELVDEYEERLDEEAEREYRMRFPEEEE